MPSPSQNFTRRVYHGGGLDPRAPDDAAVLALEALAVWTAAVALFIFLGALFGADLTALAVAEVVALAGVPIAWAIARGDARARLGLGAPSARALIGAALVGLSFWYVNDRLAEPIRRAFGDRELDHLRATLATPLAVQLAVVAVLPALCEELLTRGVLARALRPALGRGLAVAMSALLFAGFHLSIVRFAPMLALGAVLGAIALAADSVWPAVLAHLLNNAIAIVIADGGLGPVVAIVSHHPDLALVASAALSLAGLVIALAPRRQP